MLSRTFCWNHHSSVLKLRKLEENIITKKTMAAQVWMSKSLLRMKLQFVELSVVSPGLVCEESVPEAEHVRKRKLLQKKVNSFSPSPIHPTLYFFATWERRRESQRKAKYCILIPCNGEKLQSGVRCSVSKPAHWECPRRPGPPPSTWWVEKLSKDYVFVFLFVFVSICMNGMNLSASLAIMAWIPLAESSKVLMKKSLDWKCLEWMKTMKQLGGGTWCPTWGWWSKRSSLPRRAPSNPSFLTVLSSK